MYVVANAYSNMSNIYIFAYIEITNHSVQENITYLLSVSWQSWGTPAPAWSVRWSTPPATISRSARPPSLWTACSRGSRATGRGSGCSPERKHEKVDLDTHDPVNYRPCAHPWPPHLANLRRRSLSMLLLPADHLLPPQSLRRNVYEIILIHIV